MLDNVFLIYIRHDNGNLDYTELFCSVCLLDVTRGWGGGGEVQKLVFISHKPVTFIYVFFFFHIGCQEDIAKLLRYESSALPPGQKTNLMEYGDRMKAGERNIYYICAPRYMQHF